MFGLKYEGAMSHFAPVRVNETLTLDFDNWDHFEMHHYAFHVSDAEFDHVTSFFVPPDPNEGFNVIRYGDSSPPPASAIEKDDERSR